LSVEILEAEVVKAHLKGGGANGNGSSVHELGARELLYPHSLRDTGKKDSETGEPILETIIDVDAKTELPSPSGMTTLDLYVPWYENAFPFRKGKSVIRDSGGRYRINMISKNRKGRLEGTQVMTASALNAQADESPDKFLRKVQES
jgi:hypothetical protein